MPTQKSRAEYMAARRSALKAAEEQKKAPPKPVEAVAPVPEKIPDKNSPKPLSAPFRRQGTSDYKALPGDDWVRKLTQHQRDYILDRINNPNRKV